MNYIRLISRPGTRKVSGFSFQPEKGKSMRLHSLRSIILGLVCLVAVTLLAPIIAPVLIAAALFVPGLKLMRRTSDRFTLNLASFHSPNIATWSWSLSFIRPRSSDEGRWFGAFTLSHNYGWQVALQIARCQLVLARQTYHLQRSTAADFIVRSRC